MAETQTGPAVFCNQCGAPSAGGRATCEACGHPLQQLAPPSVRVGPVLYDFTEDEPDPGPSGDVPTVPVGAVASVGVGGATAAGATTQLPAQASPSALAGGFRLAVTSFVAVVTAVVAVVASFARILRIEVDGVAPTVPVGDRTVDDLATNLFGAVLLAVVALVVGAIGAGFRRRWAAGLAGGAGLAVAGWGALVLGLAERPIQVATTIASQPSPDPFTVFVTRDLGWFLAAAAATLGLVTFLVSLASVRADGHRGLNPWIAAVGAVTAVIAAAGPMIPEGAASIEANWTVSEEAPVAPALFLVGRLVQLGALALAGVLGFLVTRRYGLGLAIGGGSVVLWLAVSTLLGLGRSPIGPAVTNPGSPSDDLHAVTIVALTALVGLAVVAVLAAVEQGAREP
jgi:hypothetical protein